jgi:hypothetical protein
METGIAGLRHGLPLPKDLSVVQQIAGQTASKSRRRLRSANSLRNHVYLQTRKTPLKQSTGIAAAGEFSP